MSAGSQPARAGAPRLRLAGRDAVLLDCGTLDGALGVFAALERARESGALDIAELVPAAETVLVRGDAARRPAELASRLRALLAEHAGEAGARRDAPETVIPVVYDGEDLAEVAALTGMSADQVIERHLAAIYTGAFTGFSPGFAYLSGGDPALAVPRRQSPRPRIPAGSVGLAGSFSGIYPRESPGGWQLIGRTSHAMWDLDREQPAAVVPGARVRFVAERERVSGRGAEAAAETPLRPVSGTHAPGAAGAPALAILDPGLQTLVQDAGRPGLAALGVSPSGAADRGALASANRLVGNPERLAVLELGFGGFSAEAVATTVLALAGAPRAGRLEGPLGTRAVPHGAPFRIDAGERLILDAPQRGLRTVLALRGGVRAPQTLGSSSRDTLAGLGPEPVAAGDTILAGPEPRNAVAPPEPQAVELPAPGDEVALRIVLGPRDDWFDEQALERLQRGPWEVSPRSDRVGVRLAGEPITRAAAYRDRELPSEGMITGAIQVPPDGQPVLFLADRPVTGGYPVIGVVDARDIDLAAQLPPGARVRFVISNVTSPKENER